MALNDTTRLLKTLGDETRLRILHLVREGELSVSELMEILNMGQSRISTQLNLLKEVGLVNDRRAGRRSYYALVPGPAAELFERVLQDNADANELALDKAGLEALLRRRAEESKSYFNRVASSFGEEELPGRTWEGLCRAVLQLAPAGRYADLGIGDGQLTLMLAQVADSVTAVDHSPEMLRQLELRARRVGLTNIEPVEGEIEELPLEDGTYDVVVLSQALHHAHSPERALAEAHRILKPSGSLLVIDLLAHSEEWVRSRLQHVHLGFTEAALEQLIEASGFEFVTVQRAARDTTPPHFMTLVATGRRPRTPELSKR